MVDNTGSGSEHMRHDGLIYARKKDFMVEFQIPDVNEKHVDELAGAVRLVKTSYLSTVILLEVLHPMNTVVHKTVDHICRAGVETFIVDTLSPFSSVSPDERRGHISIKYTDGKVIDHSTIMSKDEVDADDDMIDILQVAFKQKETIFRRLESDAVLRIVAGTDANKSATII